MDADPVSQGKAEDTATLDAEQPGSSRAAQAPTTLLEELLGLPAPEYASLAAAPAQGAHSLHAPHAQSLVDREFCLLFKSALSSMGFSGRISWLLHR